MVMRVIVTGLVGQYAFGGVAWDYLQYVEGFRQLGHDVFYLEDTETWPYDPINNTVTNDCSYNISYLRDVMAKLDLGDRWIYRNCPDERYYGVDADKAKQICATADLFVNVSGAAWLRPEYRAIPRRIFIDSDPMFTQIGLLSANADVLERVRAHDVHFSFAENIGQSDCRIPAAGFNWLPTRQPIVLDWWPMATESPRDVLTTVMNWVSYKECKFAGETWGQKDVEFLRFIELPSLTAQRFEIAMGMGPGQRRPTELLRSRGWRIIEPETHLPNPWSYRNYLRGSKGEWSIAKEAYAKSRSGWFSCRSACYLALGRPCVLQDTGWSKFYRTGHGLLAFDTMEEAISAIGRVNAEYVAHSLAARALAEEYFEARTVLAHMLAAAQIAP
jgi:hypothetical protein